MIGRQEYREQLDVNTIERTLRESWSPISTTMGIRGRKRRPLRMWTSFATSNPGKQSGMKFATPCRNCKLHYFMSYLTALRYTKQQSTQPWSAACAACANSCSCLCAKMTVSHFDSCPVRTRARSSRTEMCATSAMPSCIIAQQAQRLMLSRQWAQMQWPLHTLQCCTRAKFC